MPTYRHNAQQLHTQSVLLHRLNSTTRKATGSSPYNQTLNIIFPNTHNRPIQTTCWRHIRLWSHCIRIWPIFYTDIHGRQRQNKQMRIRKWRPSQWLRAALTCTDMFRRLTVETKSFCFFQPCMPVCRVFSC
jgi:hypothetical protein